DMALHRPDPAHPRADDGDRLARGQCLERNLLDIRRVLELGAAGATGRRSSETLAGFAQLGADAGPLQLFRPEERDEIGAFSLEPVAFRADLHFLELAEIPRSEERRVGKEGGTRWVGVR